MSKDHYRTFNGKEYLRMDIGFRKRSLADKKAQEIRNRGFLTRVVKEKHYMGVGVADEMLWDVYIHDPNEQE